MNSKIIIAVVVLVVLAGGGFFYFSAMKSPYKAPADVNMTQQNTNTNPTATNSVDIKGMAFNPATITVKVGSTVTWTNSDSIGHTVTSDDGSFDTGVFRQGESKTITFAKAGTFTYHCSVHPNMTGTVIVQ